MLSIRIIRKVICKQFLRMLNFTIQRNVQVSVIGAASDIGSNLSILLKQNQKIKHLKLHDNDEIIEGIGLDLTLLPGGPTVDTFIGESNLGPAVSSSHIIVMVDRRPRREGQCREEMLECNAPHVYSVCRAIAERNREAFFAISTNPINSILPFASALLRKYNSYNPFKVFGITNIDSVRSRAFAGRILRIDASLLSVPVIGGHSDRTIVPLFSNLKPSKHSVDMYQADTLTRLVRKAGTEVVLHKFGKDSATLAMAFSINEFVEGLVEAAYGKDVTLNCFTANPYFGTRFFAGPTKIGYYGILEYFYNPPMSDYECYMLNSAVPVINKDVSTGEKYVNYIETLAKW